MTVEEFRERINKKNIKIIYLWIKNNYIPGVRIDKNGEYVIPDNARVPYTERGKCKGYSMYKSFVKAYYKGKNVVPELYNITYEKFESINNQLEDWGLIQKEYLDGLIYYNATPLGADFVSFNNTQLNKFIQMSICSVSEGGLSALLNKTA